MINKRDSILTTLLMTVLAAICCAPFLSIEFFNQTIGHWIGVIIASYFCAFTAFWLRDKI